jgi:hypothetical protein
VGGRIIKANAHPDDLAVLNMLQRSKVLLNKLEDHLGAKIEDAISAEAWKILAKTLCKGVFKGL